MNTNGSWTNIIYVVYLWSAHELQYYHIFCLKDSRHVQKRECFLGKRKCDRMLLYIETQRCVEHGTSLPVMPLPRCNKAVIYQNLNSTILPSFLSVKPTEVLLLVQRLHLTCNIGPISFTLLSIAWPYFGRFWASKQQWYHYGTTFQVSCCFAMTMQLEESSFSSGSNAIAL